MKIWAVISGIVGSGFGLAKLKKYLSIGYKIWKNRDLIQRATKAWDEINDLPKDADALRDEIVEALKDKNVTKDETDKILLAAKHLVDEYQEAQAATLPVIKQLREIIGK